MSPAGELDGWTFTAEAGQTLLLRMGATGFQPRLRLLDPTGAQVQETPAGVSANRDVQILHVASRAGTYTAVAMGQSAAGTGAYELELIVASAPFSVPAGDQGGALTNGALHAGTIAVGDLDAWSVSLAAGDRLLVRAGGEGFVPHLRLFAPDGTLVGEGFTAVTGNRDAQVLAEAAVTGTYLVVASSYYLNGQGDYVLNVARAPGAFVVTAGDQGGPLANGAVHAGTLAVGDLDLWSFTAAAGEQVRLRIGTEGFTPHLRVFGPSGPLVAQEATATTGNRDAEISLVATNAGSYSVVVSGYYFGASGSYQLHALQLPGTPVASVGDQGGPLASGEGASGTLTLGDLDAWTFTGAAGDQVILRVGTTGFTPRLRLHSPDGTVLAEEVTGTTGNRDAEIAVRLTQSGTHTAVLSAAYYGQIGDYRLSLVQFPAVVITPPDDQGGFLTNGVRHAGTLALGDVDVWELDAVAGGQVTARIGVEGFSPRLRLIGPDGALLADEAVGTTGNRDVQFTATTPLAGRHVLVVSSAYYGSSGDYVLTGAALPGPITVSPGDHGGPLVNGGHHLGTNSLGDLEFFTFPAITGDSNSVAVTTVGFTPWLRIFDSRGALVAESYTATTGNRSTRLSYTVTNNGPHTLVLGAVFRGQEGSYDLYYLRFPPDLQVPVGLHVAEGAAVLAPLSAADPALPIKPLTFALLSGPPGAVLTQEGGTNALITWPTSEAIGPSTNRFVATVTDLVDGRAFTRTNEFFAVVDEINVAPTLQVPADQAIDEGVPYAATASAQDSDLPANGLTFQLVSGPAGMTVDPLSGAVSWTPSESDGPGSFPVSIAVTDDNPWAVNARQLSVTNTFTLTVREVNRPPEPPVVPLTVAREGEPLRFTYAGTDPDLPANTLTYRLVSGPAGAALATDGTLTWTPDETHGGAPARQVHVFQVEIRDNGSPALAVTNSFAIEVEEINQPPVIGSVADATIPELAPWSQQVTATDPDLPANSLVFSLAEGPAGATISESGLVQWTPSEAQGPSTNVFKVVVTDTNPGVPLRLSATNSFRVVVTEENQAPALAEIGAQGASAGVPWSLSVAATDADLPPQSLSFTLVQGPTGMTVDSATGAVSWTPTSEQKGDHAVTLRVADGQSPALEATRTFTVTVTAVSAKLSIVMLEAGLIQATATGDPGTRFQLQVSTNLTTWTRVLDFEMGTTPYDYIDPETRRASSRFFRLLANP